jgi:hypothetical protein
MWPATHAAFYGLTVPLEGDIPHMYRDTEGWLTWGIGIRDDPGPTGTTLNRQWIKCSGYSASPAEITAEWQRIESGPLGASAAARVVSMYCPQTERDAAFWMKVGDFETSIKAQFPAWETWPADGQLALLSMAWNYGPAFKRPPATSTTGWPDLAAALDKTDFDYAAEHCQAAAGPNARSRGCKILFFQAARSKLWKDPAGTLYGTQPVVSTVALQTAAAHPLTRDADAWWVQAMLIDASLYPPGQASHDGLFGLQSAAAFGAYVKQRQLSPGYTATNLARLSADTLRVATT